MASADVNRPVDYAYASPKLQDTEGDSSAQPTGVRFLIVGLLVCMALLLYVDRFALAPIVVTLRKDLDLTTEEFGREWYCFFFAYALCQVPAGALADRYGARTMLTIYVIAWSLCVIALGFMQGLIGLLVLRALMGAAQAGAYPAAGSYLKRWVNPGARARSNSFVSAGGRVGGVLAFLVTASLAIGLGKLLGMEQGWRATLILYGVLGIVWSALFWWYFRDRPQEHPSCNHAERDLIGHEPPSPPPAVPVVAILTSSNVWLLSFAGFMVNVGWIFLLAWQTTYIQERFGDQLSGTLKEVVAGFMTALASCAGMMGGITGGVLADIFRRRFGPVWGRRIPGLLAGTLAGSAYIGAHFVGSVWLFVPLMMFISFTIDFGLGSLWATYQDFGGKNVGSVLGFANMWGNLGAGLCGWFYGKLAGQDQWPLVFTISAVALFLMSASWLLVDPTRQLLPSNSEEHA